MFLYNVLISPIELIIGYVYVFIENTFPLLGAFGNIYFVSFVVNILALPLYNKADSLQEKEKQTSKKLEYWVQHIKHTFKGNEQFMMLSAYYKENNYHPLYALRSSLSILIEIPLFIAAYHYLNNILQYDPDFLWVLKNASLPDGLISFTLFNRHIVLNLLPILMTLINYISGYIYTHDATKRDKIQIYVLGLIFLVLLYNSPSGLVFYWILNNLFSLGKNVVSKTKHPKRIVAMYIGIHIMLFGILCLIFAYSKIKSILLIMFGVAIIIIALIKYVPSINNRLRAIHNSIKTKLRGLNKSFSFFTTSGEVNGCLPILITNDIGLSLLYGLLLSSNVIATSPLEFANIGSTPSPLSYVWTALFVFIGLFLVWPLLIYKMFDGKTRYYETLIMFVVFVSSLFNAFVFKSNYGLLTEQFFLEDESLLSNISFINRLLPIVVIIATVFIFLWLVKYKKLAILTFICLSVSFAELVLGFMNVSKIKKAYNELHSTVSNDESSENISSDKIFHLTKTGKNVITIFSDRAGGLFFDSAIKDIPELKGQFDGFTYYPNTISFGNMTILGTPSMLGGYEYTPEELNKRTTEGHLQKSNEAHFVVPRVMLNNGFEVLVTDPPLPNLSQSGDLSAYKKEFGDSITVKNLEKRYTERYLKEKNIKSEIKTDVVSKKEILNFVIIECLYPPYRKLFNDKFRSKDFVSLESFAGGDLDLDGLSFIESFSKLYYLDDLTSFDSNKDQYVFIGSNITHNPAYLDASLEIPKMEDQNLQLSYSTEGVNIKQNYYAYLALLKSLGKFFDYLKANDAYDNTRIIIVSDHGLQRAVAPLDTKQSSFNPILLYKDFGAKGDIVYDNTFMTNADAPLLCLSGIGDSVNPYTDNKMTVNKSDGVNVYYASLMDINGAPFKSGTKTTLDLSNGGYHVKDNILDPLNWIELQK